MAFKMLLLNSTEPTFMFATTKPQIRSTSLQHNFTNQNLKPPSNSSKSDITGVSYSKHTDSPNNHTHCLLSCIAMEDNVEAKEKYPVMVDGGSGNSGDGGRSCRGGGSESDYHKNDSVDVYYKSMIESNPGNSLILGNYAKYLKEVRCDFTKAKEYCSRSILASPTDGSILSMYADLIWKTQNDTTSAESYFEQAMEASPNDSHVLASYAEFLWDAE